MSLRFYEIAEKNHRILNPFTEEKLMLLGEICRLNPGMRQLDLACGKGETLSRWAQTYGINGTGVDISPVFIDAACKRAEELKVDSQVSFVNEDAVQFQTIPESYDVVSCIGANWLGGGTRGTLELLKNKGLKHNPTSLVLMGEIFWRENPSDGALEGMGVKPGEWAIGLEGILNVFESSGTRLIEMVLASDSDWDRYESKHWWAFERWLMDNPDDPERDELMVFAEKSRRLYFKYERPLCDWGVFVLRLAG